MTSRRGVLKLIGGGTVLAVAGVGGFAHLSAPSKSARAPWREAGKYEEYRRWALSYALLAPNPPNLQPWLVQLKGENALTLYCDQDRRLPETDPFDRQITIGCGAFLELLKIAAAEEGYEAIITAFPEGENIQTLDARPIAHVEFLAPQGLEKDSLFEHILARRSNKKAYKPKPVPDDILSELAKAAQVLEVSSKTVGDTDLTAKLRDLTWRAHVMEVMTPEAMQESVDLMRLGAREVAINPDGIELEGAMITAGKMMGFVNRKAMADPDSTAFKQGLAMYEEMAMSARAFGWLTTEDGSRLAQLNAGRAYVRLNLKATQLGVSIHPWSQALQEYPEMSDLYREVHDLIGEGQRLQMLFRIGYADPIMPTPRRGLEAHLA